MNCLYCGKRLSLLNKLSRREFCSDEHHDRYMEDQETLGLARLIEAKQVSSAKKATGKKKGRTTVSGSTGLAEIFIEESPRIQSVVKAAFVPGVPVSGAVGVALPPMELKLARCHVPTCRTKTVSPKFERLERSDEEKAAAPSFHPAIKLPEPELSCTPRVRIPVAGPLVVTHLPAGTGPERHDRALPAYLNGDAPALQMPETGVGEPPRSGLLAQVGGLYRAPKRNGWKPAVETWPQPFHIQEVIPSEAVSSALPLQFEPGPGVLERVAELTAGVVPLAAPAALPGPGFRPVEPPVATDWNLSWRAPYTEPSLACSLPGQQSPAQAIDPPELPTRSDHGAAHPHHFDTEVVEPRTPELESAPAPRAAGMLDSVVKGPTADGVPEWPDAEPVQPRVSAAPAVSLPVNDSRELRQARLAAPRVSAPAAEGVPAIKASPLEPALPWFELPRAASARESKRPALVTAALPLDAGGPETREDGAPPVLPTPTATDWEASAANHLELGEDTAAPFQEDWLLADLLPGPAEARMLPLSLDRIVADAAMEINRGDRTPAERARHPVLPRLNLEPAEDQVAPARHDRGVRAKPWKRVWPALAGRLSSMPAGVKWGVMAVPLVAALAFHTLTKDSTERTAPPLMAEQATEAPPMPPLVPVATKPVTAERAEDLPIEQAVVSSQPESPPASRWQTFRENIMHRAAISLSDDFRSGLGNWGGAGDWARSWSYDKAGFVRPGSMALYLPTVSLTDYQFEFAGQIEKAGLSWVFRASDLNNYHAARLIITAPGPLPEAALFRYTVVNGKRMRPTQTPVPFRLRNGKMYRFRVEVRGSGFTTYLDNSVIDFFEDSRLKHGGVGFFRTRGEKSRLRWVSVMHQYDMLGRLCALIAPYNLDNPPRSWNQ